MEEDARWKVLQDRVLLLDGRGWEHGQEWKACDIGDIQYGRAHTSKRIVMSIQFIVAVECLYLSLSYLML